MEILENFNLEKKNLLSVIEDENICEEFLNKLYGTNTNLINSKSNFQLRFISKYYDLFIINKGTSRLLFGI
jgi:hypothetical protein